MIWHVKRGNELRDERLDMRCYYPLEMDALVQLGGFTTLEKLGAFDGSAFSSESPKMIYVCANAGGSKTSGL